ncbi:MAG: pectate lyase [Deltaproteobacteria bacterium]|nr:pectate lyase [Deltaproteobacteria bacterium]
MSNELKYLLGGILLIFISTACDRSTQLDLQNQDTNYTSDTGTGIIGDSATGSDTPANTDTGGDTSGDSAADTDTSDVTDTGSDTGTVSGDLNFTSTGGWFESVYAAWEAVSGATGYTVSYKVTGETSYTEVDDELIRGTRVDIPGLLGNTTYEVLIAAKNTNASSVLTVKTMGFDRSGFAFLPSSTNGSTTGGYQEDGTASDDAEILYITEGNKNSVQMDVTKDSTTTTYTGIANIMKARESAKSTVPLIVRILGEVTPPTGDAYSSGLLNIKANSNVTFEGVGTDALLNGFGLNIRAAKNIEVRNLAFYMFPDDSVSIQTDNRNIWVHNNDFMIGADGGGDKALGDGSCDIKADSSFITVSYNHFHGTGKSSLVGLNETTEFFVTFHHNFYDGSHSRHPRVRTGTIHVYNNYFKDVTTYGVGAAEGCSIFVQNNYFENTVRPMMIASQGHDMKDYLPGTGDHDSILSGEDGGTIKAEGNYMDTFTTTWFDATVDTGNATLGGAVYNNFDSNFSSTNYPYNVDSATAAKDKAVTYAGRLN